MKVKKANCGASVKANRGGYMKMEKTGVKAANGGMAKKKKKKKPAAYNAGGAAKKASMKTCSSCPSPSQCASAGRCKKSGKTLTEA